jgi:hypothetical protein
MAVLGMTRLWICDEADCLMAALSIRRSASPTRVIELRVATFVSHISHYLDGCSTRRLTDRSYRHERYDRLDAYMR